MTEGKVSKWIKMGEKWGKPGHRLSLSWVTETCSLMCSNSSTCIFSKGRSRRARLWSALVSRSSCSRSSWSRLLSLCAQGESISQQCVCPGLHLRLFDSRSALKICKLPPKNYHGVLLDGSKRKRLSKELETESATLH